MKERSGRTQTIKRTALGATYLLIMLAVGYVVGSLVLPAANDTPSESQVFENFSKNMLQVETVVNDVSFDAGFLSLEQRIIYDFSDPQQDKILIRSTNQIDFLELITTNAQIIAIGDDVYLQYVSVEIENEDGTSSDDFSGLVGRWVKVRGSDVSTADLPADLDPSSLLSGTGDFASGILLDNLDSKQYEAALQILERYPIYSYEGEVVKEQIDDIDTYRFDVTIDAENLERLIDALSIEMVEGSLGERSFKLENIDDITFWIDIESALLRKATYATTDEQVGEYIVESYYSNYDEPTTIQAPESYESAGDVAEELNRL